MAEIMFICTGNTCRSPMAQAIATTFAGDLDLTFFSRGINVMSPLPPATYAQRVVGEKFRMDISTHRSKRVEQDEIARAVAVFGMTMGHKEYLHRLYGLYSNKIFSLCEFVGIKGDIVDPFGKSITAYEKCADELEKVIKMLFNIIYEEGLSWLY